MSISSNDQYRRNAASFTRERNPVPIFNAAKYDIGSARQETRTKIENYLVHDIVDLPPQLGRRYSGVVLTENQLRSGMKTGDTAPSWSRFLDQHGIATIAHHSSQPNECRSKGWYREMVKQGAWAVEARRELKMEYLPKQITHIWSLRNDLRISVMELVDIAKESQNAGLMPIVGPIIRRKGFFSAGDCAKATSSLLFHFMRLLRENNVDVSAMALQIGMAAHGTENEARLDPRRVGELTLEALANGKTEGVPVRCVVDDDYNDAHVALSNNTDAAGVFRLFGYSKGDLILRAHKTHDA